MESEVKKMTGVYDLNGINKQLENELDEAKALLKAWQNVTFPTKKNGEPFAVMSKNFSGATYKRCNYSSYDYENELQVSVWDNRYYSSSFWCYANVTFHKDEVTKPENLIDDCIYVYDLEDIKTQVQNEIKYYKERIAKLEEDMKNSEKIYNDFLDSFKAAMEKLESDTNDLTLFTLIRDTVVDQNKYKYTDKFV